MKTYNIRGKEYSYSDLLWRLDQLEAAIMVNSFDKELDDEYHEFLEAYRSANQ